MIDLTQKIRNRIKSIFKKGFHEKTVLLSFVLVLTIEIFYLSTINEGRDFSGDTAKFQFAGKILGIIHPPGYPTYLILNNIFINIFPFGNLAFKANLLSSVFSVLASLFLFRILILLEVRALQSFITTITYSLTFTLWSQSVYAEVYTLNLLFFASTIYFFLKWHLKRDDKSLIYGCLVYSLSFGNHLSMITLLPAIFYIALVTDKNIFFAWKKILIVASFIILGALQYSYLFLRNKSTIYAEMSIENFSSFLWFVTGGWFKSKFFSFSIEEILIFSLPRLIYYLFREFLFLLPISFFGFFKFKKEIKIFFLLSILGNIILGLNYDIGDIYVYYLPSYFVLGVLMGKGIDWISRKFSGEKIFFKTLSGVIIPILFFSINYPFLKNCRNFEEDRRVKDILSKVDNDSIILTTDYRTYQFLLYFLIGEEKYKEKNVHVEFCNSLEEIRLYLCENYPFYSSHFRKNIPPGRNVYFVKSKYLSFFKKSGLKISNFYNELYKIECKKRNVMKKPFFLVEYPLKDSAFFAFHANRRVDYEISLKEDSQTIEIKGIAKISGHEERESKIFVVFKSDKKSYVFDNLNENSPDSFLVKVQKNEIEKDLYRIGIFIKGREMESLWFTDRFFGKPIFQDYKKERIRIIKSKYRKKIETMRDYLLKKLL